MIAKLLAFAYVMVIMGYFQFGICLMINSIFNKNENIEIKKRQSKIYLSAIAFSFFIYFMILVDIKTSTASEILVFTNILFWLWIKSQYIELEAIEYELKNKTISK